MNLKEFISKFRKIIIYKATNFLLFFTITFFIIYFINFETIVKRSKEIATQNIKYSYYLLEKEYNNLVNLISYLARLNVKKELNFILHQNNNAYALILLDNRGNIKKIYNFKKGFYSSYDLEALKGHLSIFKNYKRKIDESIFFISPLYPNFLGYPNSFLIGFPYFKNNKQEGYLFAIIDASITGLLKDIYVFLFSKLDKISFINYKIDYNYFDKPGIKDIKISYELDKNAIIAYAIYKTFNILFAIIIVYLMMILLDFYFAYGYIYKDYKNLISFLNKGIFQCNFFNFEFTKKICKEISKIYSKLKLKTEEINLYFTVLDLIKENKDIKTILENILSLLKLFTSCQKVAIYIFDIERNMSIVSGNNKIEIKEDTLEKIRKKLKNTNIIEENKKIYIRYFFKPFEIFYIFADCKNTNNILNLKKFIDTINLAIIIALKFYINSIQDPLTKAFSREKMKYDFLEYLELYKMHKDVFSIVMIDIDNLRKINETYGYEAGDMVLKSLVKTIKGILRKEDIIYRYGGEEFIILLPKTSLKEAVKVAEKLREKLIYIRIPYKDNIITFPISFGVTQVKDNDSLDDLIKRAYKALYKAKTNKKSKVDYDF